MSIFNGSGKPVVRPEDLVVLRIEMVNMEVVRNIFQLVEHAPIKVATLNAAQDIELAKNTDVVRNVGAVQNTTPMREAVAYDHAPREAGELVATGTAKAALRDFTPKLRKEVEGKPAYIILHFPPQSFAEQTFPEPGDGPSSFPIRARIAGESRLVFIVPDNFNIEYSLASVLKACQDLPLKVSAAAEGPVPLMLYNPSPDVSLVSSLFKISEKELLPLKRRAILSSAAVKTLQTLQFSGDADLVSSGPAINPQPEPPGMPSMPGLSEKKYTTLDIKTESIRNTKPYPKEPDKDMTSIEMPWRLILSPRSNGRWRHAANPVFSSKTKHTELWHSRLVVPHDGKEIQPPYPDKERIVRAIWALKGEGNEAATTNMESSWPSTLPEEGAKQFLTTLTNEHRYQIAHLSSNFNNGSYEPKPIDTNMMMLSALGGWLDSRGAWEPAAGTSVEEWVHRATMGRDHYVRIVERGFLFPFGHRVSLVTIHERKFHHWLDGNPACLRKRQFIVVREKERTYDDLHQKAETDNRYSFARKFPFSRVELLTEMTPDLDQRYKQIPGATPIPPVFPPGIRKNNLDNETWGDSMFWPCIRVDDDAKPFQFQCAATDREGRRVLFELPMIFMKNTMAAPTDTNKALDYSKAAYNANLAIKEFGARTNYNTANFNLQRVALAPSTKSGDTSVLAENMTFGGFTGVEFTSAPGPAPPEILRTYSNGLTRPIWVPQMEKAKAQIEPIAQLTGTKTPHDITFNNRFLGVGFNPGNGSGGNQGEVFIDVSGPGLDFSSQGDKSGGFIQPNFTPNALSRLAGPVMNGNDQSFAGGTMPLFPSIEPLPLLFGCISLGELIPSVSNVARNLDRVPKIISEAGTQTDSFFNDLARLSGFVDDFPTQLVRIAKAALTGFTTHTLVDLEKDTKNYVPTKTAVGTVTQRLSSIDLTNLTTPSWNWVDFNTKINAAEGAVETLKNASVSLPADLKQPILNTVQKLNALLNQLRSLESLISAGSGLKGALEAIVGKPDELIKLLTEDKNPKTPKPTLLSTLLSTLGAKIESLETKLKTAELLDGAPRNAMLAVLKATKDAIEIYKTSGKSLMDQFTGDELTVRFDWNPQITSWPPGKPPIFRPNDERGLMIAVESKVKKNGLASSKTSVNCSLKNFDLILVGKNRFIELGFKKIEFTIDSNAKTNVDVLLSGVKFVGPLSFVETLRDLIPLDGFSDPPYLDITKEGIDAGYSIALPSITCGVLNIANLSLGAGFTVPFIGKQPLSIRFNFCTREKPFLLTVFIFGGGGFFNITIDPKGVQMLEAALEFGAAVFLDFGVASGELHAMAGIYFKIQSNENDETEVTLAGYFRLGGSVNVLGLISASIELYMSLGYEAGKCVGKAELKISVSVAFFSTSVTISCERKFAGSNGDPTMRQMLGFNPDLTLEEELGAIGEETEYAWRDYLEAFAKEDL